ECGRPAGDSVLPGNETGAPLVIFVAGRFAPPGKGVGVAGLPAGFRNSSSLVRASSSSMAKISHRLIGPDNIPSSQSSILTGRAKFGRSEAATHCAPRRSKLAKGLFKYSLLMTQRA